MVDPTEAIDRLRERIETSDELDDADREILLEFSDELFLLRSEYSDHRHEKLLRHCTIMAENVGGLATVVDDEGAARDVVRWINRTYDNEETNRDYRLALRVFAKRVTPGDETPDSVAWVPSSTSTNYDPAPSPAEMLHWDEDVKPMLDATTNSRDAALIATAWDSGARSGEIRDLQVGDVTDHRHGLQITVEGKTGQRTVTLIPAVPHLKRWLQTHPRSDDPTAPLWSKLERGDDGLSYNGYTKILRRAAEKAGVDKPVTFTNFRKSSASYLASQGVNQATLEDHHGWTRGSSVAARYVSIFDDASDNALAAAHGLDVSEADDSPDLAPVECPRCGKETPRDEQFCVWCHQAIDAGAVEALHEQEQDLRQAVLRLVREDPELLDDIERVQDVMTVFDGRPDLHGDAEAFRDALRDE
jgi:integrase